MHRLKGTDWGELDVLILDLPPGTGDVQLAVCQDLQMSGAVAVTTPSKLSVGDVRKGIERFSTLGVSTLALVENMSYFEVRPKGGNNLCYLFCFFVFFVRGCFDFSGLTKWYRILMKLPWLV